MSCNKTSTANLKIQIPLVRRIFEFERNRSEKGNTPVSFSVTPCSVTPCSVTSFSDFSDFEKRSETDSYDYSSSEEDTEATLNENNAFSYSSTNDPRLDLFFKTVRGISVENLTNLLEKSWQVSPRDTLRTMFYVRDCRGGKGERKIFVDFMQWLWNKDRSLFEKNLPCIPFYGCFRDLRQLLDSCSTSSNDDWVKKVNPINNPSDFKNSIVSYWSLVLCKDVENLTRNESITLASKWVPIQSGLFTREMKLTHKMFRRMVRLLREKLDIVECKMSAGEWEKINFETVCSLSHKKYNRAFLRNCPDNYTNYLQSVTSGTKKMNVGQLYPSDIARTYLEQNSTSNETLNLAWENLLLKYKATLANYNSSPKRFICVVDTSNSMSGRPLEVAVSLGLFLSELYPESNFYRKFITFSQTPTLQEVKGENLWERIKNLSQSEWDMNTNLQSVFSLLLNESTPEDHPDVVLVLSDMQFDYCSTNTNLEEIESKYNASGIKRPRLIFWNLRENTIDFPATTQVSDCALVSGYSPCLLQNLLEEGEISPMGIFRKTIDNQRYDLVLEN